MHSSHTGWSSPTGSHSVTWRRAQRSARGQLLHTTQSSSGIGMTRSVFAEGGQPKTQRGPIDEGVVVNIRRQTQVYGERQAPIRADREVNDATFQ